ncbi:phage antirepressor KilAC domain-containing protein [Rhodococcus qingshengii]|uniref:phage antirepressor KilAC domain-containing protein n=1 Tax=Rhodococcus qingshengii TaxID=334542 RepID=UPI001AE09CC1|nr:phage antirepressor KilAC domain-containing protein [Rhodococcus qingshengii]MCQ4150250.1 phage antirepressor KilAC domain-containing protein [Rhodococcus qingshengii]
MTDLTLYAGKSPFDANREVRPDGSEFWDARKLQPLMGYSRWEDFQTAIERAKLAAENSGLSVEENFRRVAKVSGKRGPAQANYELSRYAAYLTALNGDPSKPESAAAQSYFVIRTREAEVAPKPTELSRLDLIEIARSAEVERLALETKVSELTPKAEYVDTFVTDADLLSFRTVASTLEIPESDLRKILMEHGWIYVETATRWSESKQKKESINRYSEYSHKKQYFRRIEEHKAPRFRGEIMHTLKITPAGANAIDRAVARWISGEEDAA